MQENSILTQKEFTAKGDQACKTIFENNTHQCSYDLHLINLYVQILTKGHDMDLHYYPSYLKFMAVARLMLWSNCDQNKALTLLKHLQREESIIGP